MQAAFPVTAACSPPVSVSVSAAASFSLCLGQFFFKSFNFVAYLSMRTCLGMCGRENNIPIPQCIPILIP